jgi:hypothetical protein
MPEFPGDKHRHLLAVGSIGFAQALPEFALFEQGADDQIAGKDKPGNEGYIGKVRQSQSRAIPPLYQG